VSPDLREAIETFRQVATEEGYDTPDGAWNCCSFASDEFLHHLAWYGIEGTIEHFEPDIPEDVEDYPLVEFDGWFHWAVRVGDFVIDWTARQFIPHAAFPLTWRCPRRVWRNCSSEDYEEYPHERPPF
jgi:hypothetical protein